MGRAICGLYGSEFQRCLRTLNPKLRICCGETDHAAGIYYIDPMEGYIQVCGVDKGWVPVATTVDDVGHILKSGWYRVVKILLSQNLTTPQLVQKVWPGFFLSRVPKAEWYNSDAIVRKIGKFVTEEENKRGMQGMTADQIMEVADDVRKKDTDGQKLERDKAKFDLDKATGKNKIYL